MPPRLIRSALGALALAAPVAAQLQLVWSDEFDGASLDATKWEALVGTGCPNLCGWGNNELQYYRAQNATVGGGTLKITARREAFGGAQYTSARLRTRGMGDWTYGRFEVRAKLPQGQGLWPAFWMFPTDQVYGGWAASGEIDVMESVGHDTDRVFGTIHYGGSWPNNVHSGSGYTLPTGTFHDDFHVFAVEWDEAEIRWYVDGVQYSSRTTWWSSGGAYPAPFDQRFHLLLNLAVGGNLPGPPDASTPFPQTFEVDWVRVWQVPDVTDCVTVFDDMDHGDPAARGWFSFSEPGASGGIGGNTIDVPPIGGGAASLDASWSSGGTPGVPGDLGGFGLTHRLDLSSRTHFEMWLDPDAGQDFVIEVSLLDDDDGDDQVPVLPNGQDDEFKASIRVGPSGPDAISGGGWQRVRIPLADFVDDNGVHTGGNGILDPVPTSAGGNGRLIDVVVSLVTNTGAPVSFRTDRWEFTRHAGTLAGRVWDDADGDGTPAGEPGLVGVTLDLLDAVTGAIVDTNVTDFVGSYAFTGVGPGPHRVRVRAATLPSNVVPTFDPDGLATPGEYEVALTCDEAITTLDLGYGPAPLGTNLCSPAVTNSTGVPGHLAASGSASVVAGDLNLLASSLPPGALGYFLVSPNPGFVMHPGGSTGHLCLLPPFGRYVQFATAVAPDGTMSLDVDLSAIPQPTSTVSVQPGETWYFQLWHRDSTVGIPTSNFTDGLAIPFT